MARRLPCCVSLRGTRASCGKTWRLRSRLGRYPTSLGKKRAHRAGVVAVTATAAGLLFWPLGACVAVPAEPPGAPPAHDTPSTNDEAPALAAPAADADLPIATPSDVGMDTAPLLALRDAVAAGTFPRTTSLLVAKDGRLVFEEYFEGGGPDVLNDTRSAMKSVTSLAVGAALADGRLRSVRQPAFPLLPDLAPFAHDGPLKQGITVEDFLTMSSALDCNDWDEANPGNEENMYPLREWARWAVDRISIYCDPPKELNISYEYWRYSFKYR